MTLLELLIKKLPQCAGWPKDAARCIYHEHKEGATFYDVEGAMVKNGVGFIDLCIPDVRREEVTREQYEAALAASKPEWDGEGLPPVGTQCEFISNDNSWGKVDVIGFDGDKVVFKPSGENYYGIAPSQRQIFRPIRSEADNKRDEAVAVMNGLWTPNSKMHCEAIYDAIKSGKIVID